MSERSRTDNWSSPQIILAIVLAILTAQAAYERFNGQTESKIAVLQSQLADVRERVRELERGRRDGGQR